MSVTAEAPGLEKLGNSLMQPGWTPSGRQLVDKGMGEFVLEDAGQVGRHGTEAADRNAELAVIDRTRPGRGMGDVEEGLLGVKRDQDVVAGLSAQVADAIVVVGLERGR